MGFSDKFDTIVINDDLDKAVGDTDRLIRDFCRIP